MGCVESSLVGEIQPDLIESKKKTSDSESKVVVLGAKVGSHKLMKSPSERLSYSKLLELRQEFLINSIFGILEVKRDTEPWRLSTTGTQLEL
jgi:hypothetical protein